MLPKIWTMLAVGLLVSCFLLSGENLSAQLVESLPAWTHTASACSPDEAALPKYAFSNADFSFNSTTISDVGGFGLPIPIVVRCNVLNPLDAGNPVWNSMFVGYQDPDGTGITYQVIARLKRLSRATGGIATIATFNSNLSSNTARGEGLVTFSHTFDFLRNEYFVEILISRIDKRANPVAYMVRLEQTAVIK